MGTTSKKVEELTVGDRVDLASCPYLKNHPTAEHEYARVSYIENATEQCFVVGYAGIDRIGYPVGTILEVRTPKDVPDPEVKVRTIAKPEEWTVWNISQNLTDRWSEINYYNAEEKPLELLEDDEELLLRLRDQMWDEITFIVRKDGNFGILFEVEFCSKESEDGEKDADPSWYASLKPHAEVVKALLEGMKSLAVRYPHVQFAVPDESHIFNDRPAAWAFVPDGLLSTEQREELGTAMLSL